MFKSWSSFNLILICLSPRLIFCPVLLFFFDSLSFICFSIGLSHFFFNFRLCLKPSLSYSVFFFLIFAPSLYPFLVLLLSIFFSFSPSNFVILLSSHSNFQSLSSSFCFTLFSFLPYLSPLLLFSLHLFLV